jgi:tRNA(fMet)-specific endonuclease VapC
MAVVVDTDVVSYLFKDDSRARWYRPRLVGQVRVLSFMAIAELEKWALMHRWGATRRQRLESYLRAFEIQDSDVPLCRRWAEVMVLANRKGRPLEMADAWHAATALALGVPLMTHNANDYAGVDGLTMLTAP